MKELSIEEKVKRYDEALERARLVLQERGNEPDGASVLSDLFPELAESDDERIRKAIKLMYSFLPNEPTYIGDVPVKDIFAWLEKQGEQKPNKCMYSNDNYTDEDRKVLCDGCEEDCKLKQKPVEWSKEDKDMIERIISFVKPYTTYPSHEDIKYRGEMVQWLKSLKERVQPKQEWSEEDKEFINDLIGVFDGQQYQAHSDEEIVKWLKSIRLPYNKEWDENDEEMLKSIIATCELACEDRDSSPAKHLLEMQTKWLKSLIPQKQQYDEWSDEDKEFLKLTLSNLTELKDRYGEGYGRVGECIKWLNSLQPQPIDVEAAYQDGYQKAVVEFSQKQQEWTQEDIDMIDWLIRCCETEYKELCNDKYGHQEIVSDLKRDCRKKWDWLESIKGKVVPQKQCSYNPYKAAIESIAKMCDKYVFPPYVTSIRDFRDNLKVKCKEAVEYDNLYPQKQWKPSEEQIKAMYAAVNLIVLRDTLHPDNIKALDSLYNDLKAL